MPLLLAKFWREGIIAALVIALGIVMWRADAISGQRDKALEAVGACKANLATTQTSLDGALGHIEDSNRRVTEAAARLEQTKREAAAAEAAANARWERTRASVAALEASARDHSQPACEASSEALRALEGL